MWKTNISNLTTFLLGFTDDFPHFIRIQQALIWGTGVKLSSKLIRSRCLQIQSPFLIFQILTFLHDINTLRFHSSKPASNAPMSAVQEYFLGRGRAGASAALYLGHVGLKVPFFFNLDLKPESSQCNYSASKCFFRHLVCPSQSHDALFNPKQANNSHTHAPLSPFKAE